MDEEKDIYNLPIAAFTFGKNGQAIPYFPIQDLKDNSKDNKADSKKNFSVSFESKGSKESNAYSNEDSEKRFSFKNILKKNANDNHNNNNKFNENITNNNFDNNNNYIFIDKEDSNSSYLKMILYSISYMKLLNNYILNELQLNKIQQNSSNGKLLLIIRDILIKIDQIRNIDKNINNNININNIINIEILKENLSTLFKSKKKFQKNAPDDPIDFLYVIINSLHLLKLKKGIIDNPNSKSSCSEECFGHKNLSINILKLYECECKGRDNKMISKNNYFIDIPLNLILNKFSKNNLNEINQKLFVYYKHMMSKANINIDCPKFGNLCKINKVHYKYILKNTPSYLIFNLENDYFKNNLLFFPLNKVLKSFILIPHILNINSIFDSFNNNQNYYELMGIIFLKVSKVYTCMFKQNEIFNYYEDNVFINFKNYYDIILFCMKNGLIPVSLFYQNIDLNIGKNYLDGNSIHHDINYELNKEQIMKLEKYVKNTDGLNKNLKNKIRTNENIISDNYTINYKYGIHSYKNNNNLSLSDNYNSSRYSGSVNSYSSFQKNEYICNHCERINKMENKKCFFCGYDNNALLKNINVRNIKKQKSIKSSGSNKNTINKNISLTQESDNKLNNQLGEIEDEYKNIDPNVLKYFDMPMPYIPQQSKKSEIKNSKQSPKTNKKIPHNNNNSNKIINKVKNNNIINKPINIISDKKDIINIDNSTLFVNSESNTLEDNLLKKLNQNNNIKKNYKIIHKKRNNINKSDNIINSNNYYSELNNKQLNINLKINNNNNYNIFEFSNRKNLINFEEYSHNNKENTNFTDRKDMTLKSKQLKKYNSNNFDNNNIINTNNNNNNYNKDFNRINLGLYFSNNLNEKWKCDHCLNMNNNETNICHWCKMERNNNNDNMIMKNYNYFSYNNINVNNNILNDNKKKKNEII
jgi:hypothetical protein